MNKGAINSMSAHIWTVSPNTPANAPTTGGRIAATSRIVRSPIWFGFRAATYVSSLIGSPNGKIGIGRPLRSGNE